MEADLSVHPVVSAPVPPAPGSQRPFQWGSALQFGLGVIAVVGSWLFAFLMGVFGLVALASQRSALGDTVSMFLMAGSLAGSGLLLLPSLYYGLMRLLGRPAVDSLPLIRRARPEWWIVLLPILLLVGFGVSQVPAIAWLLLPPLHLLAVGIPVAWMLYLSVRGLPLGSSQRAWGVFAAGMALGPFLISIAELGAMAAAVVLAAGYIASDTRLATEMMRLVQQIQSGSPSQEEIMQMFTPYLTRPAVIVSVIAFGSLIVPLTEEALKSIGVWLLVGRRISPQAGFAAGAISGAGYAFMESLLLTSNGQGWAALMVARIGTSALHVFTTAMMGWALVLAWQKGRYLRLAATYLGMVALHGTWNGLTLYTAFQTLDPSSTDAPIGGLALIAPAVLMGLAVASLFGLVLFNRMLVQGSAAQAPSGAPSGAPSILGAGAETGTGAEVFEDPRSMDFSLEVSDKPVEPAGETNIDKENLEQ